MAITCPQQTPSLDPTGNHAMTVLKTIRGAFGLRRPLVRIGAVLSALVLAACEPVEMGASGPQTGQAIDPSQPVPVALLVPGGTGSADLDWLARSLTNSAKMAAADARGATIDLRIYNAGSEPGTAVAQANKAVAEGAKIILGPLFADSANAVGNAMAPQGINVLSFSNNTDIAGGNVFVLGNTFDNVADRLVKYGVRNGKRRITDIDADPARLRQLMEQGEQEATAAGAKIKEAAKLHPAVAIAERRLDQCFTVRTGIENIAANKKFEAPEFAPPGDVRERLPRRAAGDQRIECSLLIRGKPPLVLPIYNADIAF